MIIFVYLMMFPTFEEPESEIQLLLKCLPSMQEALAYPQHHIKELGVFNPRCQIHPGSKGKSTRSSRSSLVTSGLGGQPGIHETLSKTGGTEKQNL